MLKVDNIKAYTDLNGLEQLKTAAKQNAPEAIQQVAKQFESLFLNMVLKNMREAKLSDGILDNEQSQAYQEMYDQQLALNLAQGKGTGLAALVAQQLSPAKNKALENHDISDYLKNPLAALPEALANETASRLSVIKQWQSRASSETVNASEASSAAGSVTTSNSPKQNFIDKLLPMAKQAAAELGVDPKVLVAQAALETAWGKSVIKLRDGSSTHNLFNIKVSKAWEGKQAKVSTLEFEGGVARKTQSGFRAYESYAESFNDYVKFLKENPRYQDALKAADSPAGFIRELQEAGYATDPQYAKKVMSIYGKLFAGNSNNSKASA